jgi:hypothetical protein
MFFGGLAIFRRRTPRVGCILSSGRWHLIGVEIWSVMIISVADLLRRQTSAMEACAIRSSNRRKQGSRSAPGLPSTCEQRGTPKSGRTPRLMRKILVKSLQRSGLSGNVCSGTRRRNIVTRRSMLLSAPAFSNSCLARGREFAWPLRW